MNRVRKAAAVLLVAALGLAACGDDPGGEGGAVELTLMVPSYGDKTQPYWEDLVADFQAANSGVTVKLEVQSWENIFDVVRTNVQGGKAPDILELDASGPAYGKEGLLYRADEIVSAETLADIEPGFVESAAIEGVAYGVPTVASTRALFYNKELFARAGVTEPPGTWDELLDAAKRISALGGGVYGYGMPLGKEEAQAETSIWTYGAGGSWGDGEKITVDTPEATEALDFMKRMIDEGATQPDPGATDRTPLMNVFIQGKIGMIEGLPPVVGQVREKNPALDWGIAPSPTRDGEPVTLGVADYFVAFKNDEAKLDAVRAFLDFFYQRDNYVRFNDNEGFIPATKSGAEAAAAKPELRSFLDALPGAKFYPAQNVAWSATSGAFKDLVGQIQTRPSAEVLREIQAKADEAAEG